MIPEQRIDILNGYPLKDNWYGQVRINTEDQNTEALHLSWGSATKDRGEACHRCRGRGYTRKDLNVGCHICHGTGVGSDEH